MATSQGIQKRGERKRLLQERRSLGQLRFRKVFRIAGHEEHANPRLQRENAPVKFRPAQTRHYNIGDQQIDRTRIIAGNLQSVLRRRSFQDAVTRVGQDFCEGMPQGRLIIDKQQCGVRPSFGRRRPG